MGIKRTILYVWRPEYRWYMEEFPESLLCYHIDDEYSFDPSRDVPVSETEMTLLQRADLVFIHSKTLMAKKGKINPKTYYMPNGVAFDLYKRVMEAETEEPPDLKDIPAPRIGYVGYLKRHLNLRLLLEIARKRREWSIVLVGPVRREHPEIANEIVELELQPNVYFLGSKSVAAIPRYIKELDVCLMNYKRTPYTRYIYPMKLHEYLAFGKPVVATPLENLKEFSDVLYFAEDTYRWIEAIEKALNEADRELPSKRIAIARANSWGSRVEDIAAAFEELLENQVQGVSAPRS